MAQEPFTLWLLGGIALILGLVVAVLLVRRRIAPGAPAPVLATTPASSAPEPTDSEALPRVRAWLAGAPGHVPALRHMLHEQPRLRARAETAEQELIPLRARIVSAEEECEQLRQELGRRQDELEELRKDWERMTQRVSAVLLELLEKKHDER